MSTNENYHLSAKYYKYPLDPNAASLLQLCQYRKHSAFFPAGTFRLVKLRVVWLFDLRPYYMILVISTLTCQRTCCSSLFIITFSLFRRQGCSHSMPLARFMHARIIKSPSLLETAARLHMRRLNIVLRDTQTCTFKSQCSKV